MPQILPFRGLRYSAAAGAMDDLLAPPYDIITAAQQKALAARSPYNAVHLELPDGGDERYASVAALFESWQAEGKVVRDELPMLYVYEQRFSEGGILHSRRALLAEVEAQPWEEGAIKPHEYTMSGPKEDRLKLLEATHVQFSPVFMIARDRAGQLRQFLDDTIASQPADIEARTMDGDHHGLWLIEAGRYEMRRLAPLLSESFTIADGHHRYETAANYKQRELERSGTLERDHPARFAMAAVVAADDAGLVIRPIHRIVPRPAPADFRARLGSTFSIAAASGSASDTAAIETAQASAGPSTIVALNLVPGTIHALTPVDDTIYARLAPNGNSEEWMRISPNLCRYGILQPLWGIGDDELRAGAVEYTHDTGEVLDLLRGREACAFLLQPVSVHETIALADRGDRMPQKSTFFHPKLGTGLVFHPLYP